MPSTNLHSFETYLALINQLTQCPTLNLQRNTSPLYFLEATTSTFHYLNLKKGLVNDIDSAVIEGLFLLSASEP